MYCNEMEWNGMESSVAKQSRMEWSEAEAKPKRSRAERSGSDQFSIHKK